MKWAFTSDSLRNTQAHYLYIHLRDIGGKILVYEDGECLIRLLFKSLIICRSWQGTGESLTSNRTQSLGNCVGILDGFQRFESVQIIDQNWDRLRSVCAQEGGELQKRRGARKYDLEMLAREELF